MLFSRLYHRSSWVAAHSNLARNAKCLNILALQRQRVVVANLIRKRYFSRSFIVSSRWKDYLAGIWSPKLPDSAMDQSKTQAPLVWIDCEMTGLDVENDVILSMACFVTGPSMEMLDEAGLEIIVHHDKDRMDQMGEWCTKTHGDSGLTQRVLDSKVTANEATEQLLNYIKRFVPETRQGLLAGNSVHADKAFLSKAPYNKVLEHLHYRILDVSSIKEAAKRWAPKELLKKAPRKKGLHDARQDILESIEEARFYRDVIFKPLYQER